MQPVQKIETWAIVEVMGNKKIAGLATTEVFGSTSMLRVDIPETKNNQPFTQYYGMSSLYCISPVDEQTAIRMVESLSIKPPVSWELTKEISIKAVQIADERLELPQIKTLPEENFDNY